MDTATLDKDKLATIYTVYMNQSRDKSTRSNVINYYYSDGVFYTDENLTPSSTLTDTITIESLMNRTDKECIIRMDSTYYITEDENWTPSKSFKIVRNTPDRMIGISEGSTLTVSGNDEAEVIFDGSGCSNTTFTAIRIAKDATLNMHDDVIIQNCMVKKFRAGAVHVDRGIFNLYGGVIKNNLSDNNDGAIIMKNGYINMSGGSIINNFAPENRGVLITSGIMNITGGEVINNSAPDIVVSSENGKLIVEGGSIGSVASSENGKIIVNGGTVGSIDN